MACQFEKIPLELPSDVVEESGGFSLDIGGSTIKLVFRSKDDYEAGKPRREELKSGSGRVHVVPCVPRSRLEDVIDFIRSQCDLLPAKQEIRTCGTGCNLYREGIEKELNVKLNNLLEMDCFIRAFNFLAKARSRDDLFYPPNEEALEEGKKMIQKMSAAFSKLDPNDFNLKFDFDSLPAPEIVPEGSLFPCVVAVCGTGFAFMRVEEDGTWKLLETTVIGGRMFQGLAASLTGEKDFLRLYAAVERGCHDSIDEFSSDLTDQQELADDDKYGQMMEDFSDKPVMPFGRAVTRDRESIKDDDILRSLYTVWCGNLVSISSMNCLYQGVRNVFFSGGFVENDRARNIITTLCIMKNTMLPEEQRLRVGFLRNGVHLGALGAFMKANAEQAES